MPVDIEKDFVAVKETPSLIGVFSQRKKIKIVEGYAIF